MSKHLYILGAGHGITTPGKRSPRDEDGNRVLHEWDVVRMIALLAGTRLDAMGVDHILMNASCEVDIGLKDRVKYVDYYHKEHGNVIYLPLHINAKGMGRKWNDARGTRIHHYSKRTLEMAQTMVEAFEANTQFPRVDTYKYKFYKTVTSRHLYELRKPKCPVLLPEMGFMTNKLDAQYLASQEGQEDCADSVVEFVRRWEGRS